MTEADFAGSIPASGTDQGPNNPAELRIEIENIRGELTATVAALTTKLDMRNRLRRAAVVLAVVTVAAVAGRLLTRRRRR